MSRRSMGGPCRGCRALLAVAPHSKGQVLQTVDAVRAGGPPAESCRARTNTLWIPQLIYAVCHCISSTDSSMCSGTVYLFLTLLVIVGLSLAVFAVVVRYKTEIQSVILEGPETGTRTGTQLTSRPPSPDS